MAVKIPKFISNGNLSGFIDQTGTKLVCAIIEAGSVDLSSDGSFYASSKFLSQRQSHDTDAAHFCLSREIDDGARFKPLQTRRDLENIWIRVRWPRQTLQTCDPTPPSHPLPYRWTRDGRKKWRRS